METVKMTVDKNYEIADTDKRIFSSFLEHVGRAIYSGIYEPGHPEADGQGFRKDVIKLIKELGVSHVRYPGGNFVSGYNWKDGIGPKNTRPKRLELAWNSIESNQVGIDEFYDWSIKAGIKVMCAVNMGTGTPKEAGELLEYCNFPKGTYWSDLRAKNGHKKPMDIKLWCVGNEMDGSWQICHLTADEYGKKALETSKIMKLIDPSIELVVCGSSSPLQSTFPEWDRTVLENTYDVADYISLHRYYENEGNDLDFIASFVDMDRFISSVVSTADYVKAVKRSSKTINLSFDEWNVWYHQQDKPNGWHEAPELLENRYTLLDALTVAGMGMCLVNHADRVKIACLAQLVNAIAPIFTERGGKAIRQTTFYPFKYLSHYGCGTVLKTKIVSPTAETKYGDAPLLYTATVYQKENECLNIFCLNISKKDIVLNLDLSSFGKLSMQKHICLNGNDLKAANTFDNPNCVIPHILKNADGKNDNFEIKIPSVSFNVLSFRQSAI